MMLDKQLEVILWITNACFYIYIKENLLRYVNNNEKRKYKRSSDGECYFKLG